MGDTPLVDWSALLDFFQDNWLGISGGVFAVALVFLRVYYPRYLQRRDAVRDTVVKLLHHIEKLEPQLADAIARRTRLKDRREKYPYAFPFYAWLAELDKMLEHMDGGDFHLFNAEYRQKLIEFQDGSKQVFGYLLDKVEWDPKTRAVVGPSATLQEFRSNPEDMKAALLADQRIEAESTKAYHRDLREFANDISAKYKVPTSVLAPNE